MQSNKAIKATILGNEKHYLGIIVDLHKSSMDSTEISIYLLPDFPNVNILYNQQSKKFNDLQ